MLENVKNHIYSIMLVSLAAGVAMIFSPSERYGIGKYIKYIISLIIIITLLMPFKDIIYMIPKILSEEMSAKTVSNDVSAEGALYDEIIKMTVDSISSTMAAQIDRDYSTEVLEINIETDMSDIQNIQIIGITVVLEEGTDVSNMELIRNELEEQYNCPIECNIKAERKVDFCEENK